MQVSVSGPIGTAFLAALLLVPGGQAAAQIEHDYTQVKYDRGLNVQPAFEGWVRNPDGTIDLWFGYLNRNWAQRLHIPIGPDNTLEPGGPDHGQPTFFHARRHRYAFKVTVPEGWNDEYTWTLTVNGRTDTIHAALFLEDELLEHNVLAARGQGFGIAPRNRPPSIAIDTAAFTTAVSGDRHLDRQGDRRWTAATADGPEANQIDQAGCAGAGDRSVPGEPPRAPGRRVDPVARAGAGHLRGRGSHVPGGRGGPPGRPLSRASRAGSTSSAPPPSTRSRRERPPRRCASASRAPTCSEARRGTAD